MTNPLIPKKPKGIKLNNHKSAGILDDYAVRKNVATREGTIEKTPVNNSDIVNKAYVDTAVSGAVMSPAGVDTQVQYNDGGVFGAAALYWDKTNHYFGVYNVTPAYELDVKGSGYFDQNLYVMNGNVGIGTTSPTNTLQVTGAGKGLTIGARALSNWSVNYDVMQIGGKGTVWSGLSSGTYYSDNVYYDGGWKYLTTAPATYIGQNAGIINLQTAASGTINTAISWNAGLNIIANGNVGIGTTSPDVPLHIYGNGAAAWVIRPAAGGNAEFILGEGTGANQFGGMIWSSAFNQIRVVTQANQAQLVLDNATGSVGIGTTSPSSLLHLNITDSTRSFRLDFTSATGGRAYDFNPYLRGVSNAGFEIYDVTGSASRLAISSTGNIGIGTTTPQNKLDIEGGAVIGATYSGTNTAPTNGLLVEGNVGIGTTSPDDTLQVVGTTKFGNDTTNYISTEADGLINMSGTARVYERIFLDVGTFLDDGNPATKNPQGNFSGLLYQIGEVMLRNFIVPRGIDPNSTDIDVALIWAIDEDFAPNSSSVCWNVDWSAVPQDASETWDAPGSSDTITWGDLEIPTDAKTITKTAWEQIAYTDWATGDLIGLKISRVGLSAGNDPTANPILLGVEIRFIKKYIGDGL